MSSPILGKIYRQTSFAAMMEAIMKEHLDRDRIWLMARYW